jgi:tripartite-type tricarboxylate transporter receptor subunit TctC
MAIQMLKPHFIRRICAAVLAAVLVCSQATADPVEDFYKGKTLRVVVGYGAGGGYDIYARVFAEQIGKYLPGKPTAIVQNMPGAGSFLAVKHLHDVAPKDGTAFAVVSQTMPLDVVLSNRNDVSVTALRYVGRLVDGTDIGVGAPGAPFQTYDDAKQREIVVGSTTGASPAYLVPVALVAHGGAKFKIVSGYSGSTEIVLAMERKEVQLAGGIGLPGVIQRNPDWILQRKAPVLFQAALKRHSLLPHVPTIGELGLTPADVEVLKAIAASSDIGRAVLTTPGVPDERLAALRKAFDTMVADPDFVDMMKMRGLELGAASGAELDTVARNVVLTPRTTLDKIQALIASAK